MIKADLVDKGFLSNVVSAFPWRAQLEIALFLLPQLFFVVAARINMVHYKIRGRDLVLATKAQILSFYADQKETPAMHQAPLCTLRFAIRARGGPGARASRCG